MTETEHGKEPQLILPHQQAAFDRITAIARVCFNLDRRKFPLTVRTNILITSPSGGGKSHIARAAAIEMEVPIFPISTSEWILLGSSGRGSAPTWPRIHEFLMRCARHTGGIILIDELDKIGDNNSGSVWSRYLRSEVFGLLDLIVPPNLVDRDGDAIPDTAIDAAQLVLKSKILIIGAGAFQSLWDKRQRRTLGFLAEESRIASLDLGDLFQILPRELLARFGSNLIVLPPLDEGDYFQMLDAFAARMEDFWKPRFTKLGRERIPEAARLRLGPRFFEELVLEMVLAERLEMANFSKNDTPQRDLLQSGIDASQEYGF